MESADRNFQVFVKPVGASCNLSCTYCYYSGNTLCASNTSPVMSIDLCEKQIIQHIGATTDDTIFFSWHGGEPLLAGISFYREALRMQQENNYDNRLIINGIQTNGTLIDKEWADFFAENRFLVGLSLDGPEDLHNYYRVSRQSRGSFAEVMNGWALLTKGGVKHEIVCTLNDRNSQYPEEVYRFFKENGASYISFIPVVERERDGSILPYSVKPDVFGNFLTVIFDMWKSKDIGKIEIQIFEEALRPSLNLEHSLCIFRPECGGVPALEKDGSLYSCDHFVSDDYYLGNIESDTIAEMLDSERQKRFGRDKRLTLPGTCRMCEVLEMCNGGCPKNRFKMLPGEEYAINYLCSGYRSFFNHIKPFSRLLSTIGETGL